MLPEGPAAKALQEMTKPKRIAITDSFWFELLKVQLPGMLKPGFFESHYSEPTVLDSLVRDAYFLQLVATNEHSANFRTFLRFWARLLHYFRTSPSDAKPCSFSAVLSLSLLCRCLLKQFSECLTAHELLFQLEQVPLHKSEDATGAPKCQDGHISVSYCGKHLEVQWPPEPSTSAASLFVEPLCSLCPEDAAALREDSCMLRTLPTGEHFSVAEAMERLSETDTQEVVLCPSAVPYSRGSVLRSVFREIVDFLLYSTFGAVNSTSPSLHGDSEAESQMQRNLSMSPTTMRLQAILHEILLLLFAVAAVKQPKNTSTEKEPGWPRSNCAPFRSAAEERRLAEMAFRLRAEAAEAVGASGGQDRARGANGLEPKMLSPGEPLSLPFLQAFAEVLDGEDHEDGANGTAAASHVKSSDGLTSEAFLATLLNCLWLEPHAALLPNPPKEVLDFLTKHPGDIEANPYRGVEVTHLSLASGELMPGLPSGFVADDGAAVEAGMAGKGLAKRALLVLLLLLFHNPQANAKIRVAFASLTDPRFDRSGSAYATITAPIYFPKLLRAILQKLQEPGYPLLFYCLVIQNAKFRRYCQGSADKVLPSLLEVLHGVATSENKILAKAPTAVMALLLSVLSLTGDAAFCGQMSAVKLLDGRSVLGASHRSVQEIPLSSMLVVVILRLAHWNFGACRDAFFNRTVAAILGNLAVHGIENVHWHAAKRMLEVAGLLARNAIKLPNGSSRNPNLGEAAELHRSRMVRSLLASLLRLVSSCFRLPRVSANCHLVYALQKNYPAQFTQLEADPDLGPPLMHVRTATDWFEAQCPATDETDLDVDAQVALLEEASTRLPAELMTLASVASASMSGYAETEDSSAYFLPAVWEAAQKLLPDHVCWSSSSTKTS